MAEKFYSEQLADIYCGHAIEVFKQLPDESVQLCMTSPPYWGLRNYSGGSDIVWGGDPNCQHVFEGSEYHEHRAEEVVSGKSRTTERFYGSPSRKFNNDVQRHYSNVLCVNCGAFKGQLGLEPTPELYVEHLMLIFKEVKRVLKREGSFWLNLGDTYSASPTGSLGKTDTAWERPSRTESTESRKMANRKFNMPPKCMVCIPERVMLAMISDGWSLRNKCIWHKSNSMPGSQKDRLTCSWEYLYFFTKNNTAILWRNELTGEWRDKEPTRDEKYPLGGRYRNISTGEVVWERPKNTKEWEHLTPVWHGFDYYFELDQIRVPHQTQSLERYQRQVNFGDRRPDNKYLDSPPYPDGVQPVLREGHTDRVPKWFKETFPYTDPLHTKDYSPLGKNPGDHLEITTAPFKGAHFAVYPERLCEMPIRACSRVGDVVLDMFAGSGTTGVVAKRLGRKAILIDVVEKYCIMARYRVQGVEYQPELETK